MLSSFLREKKKKSCLGIILCNVSGVELLKEFQDQYTVLEKERQELANAEKLFDLPITKFDGLIEVDRDLRNMDKVYELYEAQRVRDISALVQS